MNKFPNTFDWFMIRYGFYFSIFNFGAGIIIGSWFLLLWGLLGVILYPFIVKIYKESDRIDETANSR